LNVSANTYESILGRREEEEEEEEEERNRTITVKHGGTQKGERYNILLLHQNLQKYRKMKYSTFPIFIFVPDQGRTF